MFRDLAQCRYCKQTEVALDNAPELLLNPDGADHNACVHLVWIDGRYSQWDPRPHGPSHMIGSTEFRWDHPGFAEAENYQEWIDYLFNLANSGKKWDFAPETDFEIGNLNAEEKARTPKGQEYTAADVDGFAIFARDAAAFVQAIPLCQERLRASLDVKGKGPGG